jgi:hypothetical protein
MGMYAYNEPGVEKYAPHPAFYYLYYMQKCLGDVLLNTSVDGSGDLVAYSSAFTSGHLSTILVNKGSDRIITRINVPDTTVGNNYYTYTLTGGDAVPSDPLRPFSRKVSVNGCGPAAVAGGPVVYDTIRAESFSVGNEVRVETPPFSAVYVLLDTGNIQLETRNKISPLIHWNVPADITFGNLLTSKQLNATTTVPGQFIYDPPGATLLNAGEGFDLKVTFIPADTATYYSGEQTVKINVKKATPLVYWDTPSDISYGTLLDEAQLDATANVKGTFLYNPPEGTMLNAGTGQDLTLYFLPNDTANYNSVTKTVKINVIVTGLTETSRGPGLNIYPVPAMDILMITPPDYLENGQDIKYSICSIDGQIVHSFRVFNDGAPVSVSIKELPPGIYLLRLQTDSFSLMKRFIKL